jgi:hypothetical protein
MKNSVLFLLLIMSASNAFAYSNACLFYMSQPSALFLPKEGLQGPVTQEFIDTHKIIKIVYFGIGPSRPKDGPVEKSTNTIFFPKSDELSSISVTPSGNIAMRFLRNGVGYDKVTKEYVYVPFGNKAYNPFFTITIDPKEVISITGLGGHEISND